MIKPEVICPTKPFNNGSSPTWCRGNSMVCRVGERVFVSNPHLDEGRHILNCTYFELFEKKDGGEWKLVFSDEGIYQREPATILYLGNNVLAVTVNPTARPYAKDEPSMYVDCTPLVYLFDISGEPKRIDTVRLTWDDPNYRMTDHSYRSNAVDMENGNMIFSNQYVNETGGHHCYTVVDKNFKPLRQGKLVFAERSCYQNIAMKGNEAYVFAVRDIHEPVKEWEQYKLEKTGNTWDYDFRAIYLNYSPDITKEDFRPSVTVCHRDDTCGWTTNADCCYDKNGDMLLLVAAQNIHFEFMRDKFFPNEPLETVLELYRFSGGVLKEKVLLDRNTEENGITVNYTGFFHTAANGDVYLVWGKSTTDSSAVIGTGTYLSRVDAPDKPPVKLMDTTGDLFGNKTRLGAPAGNIVDMYWPKGSEAIMYARYDLK